MKRLHAVLLAAAICSACVTGFAAENSLNIAVPSWQQDVIYTEAAIGNGAFVKKDNDTGIGHGVTVNEDKNKDSNKNKRWNRGHGPSVNGDNDKTIKTKKNPWRRTPYHGHGPSVNGDNDNTIKTKPYRYKHGDRYYWEISDEDYMKNKDNIQQNSDYQRWRMRHGKAVFQNNDH